MFMVYSLLTIPLFAYVILSLVPYLGEKFLAVELFGNWCYFAAVWRELADLQSYNGSSLPANNKVIDEAVGGIKRE